MKKIIILMLVTLLAISSISLGYATDEYNLNYQEMHEHDDNTINPMYDAHLCHIGIDHRECEKRTFYYPGGCGCVNYKYNCCCGKVMRAKVVYCKDHINFGG